MGKVRLGVMDSDRLWIRKVLKKKDVEPINGSQWGKNIHWDIKQKQKKKRSKAKWWQVEQMVNRWVDP